MIAYSTIPAIPSIIAHSYDCLGFCIGTAIIILAIYLLRQKLRNCTHYLIALVIIGFNIGLFFFKTGDFNSLSKGIAFLRGYGFASIQITLVYFFTSFRMKIAVTITAYITRFVVVIHLDLETLDVYTIVRHIFIDIFVIYMNYSMERQNRAVFQKFYEHREELIKFKELLAEHLPQSVLVLNNHTRKPLFTNKAFTRVFEDNLEDIVEPDSATLKILLKSNSSKMVNLNLLKVDKNTIREAGTAQPYLQSNNDQTYLRDLINELVENKILDYKTVSLSTSCSSYAQNRSFEVLLTKFKWDAEDAVVVMLNDTTYQDKLISLKIANSNKDQVIATVSHELRTPLNGIIGILQIIQKKIHDDEISEYLGLCRDNAHLLLSLVNSLLDLQQIKQGKLRLNPSTIDIRKLMQDIMRLFHFQSIQKGIYIKLEINEKVPIHIVTDENRLKQILINLVGNAIKFTCTGGIVLQVAQSMEGSEYLEIAVIDTGVGIRENDLDNLFKMYGKLDDVEGVNKNGIGLGLMISNTLARILGNKTEERAIQVVSIFKEGSRFSFNILQDLAVFVKDENHITSQKKRSDGVSLNTDLDKADDSLRDIPHELLDEQVTLSTLPARKRGYLFGTKKTITDINSHTTLPKAIMSQGFISEDLKREPTSLRSQTLICPQTNSENNIQVPKHTTYQPKETMRHEQSNRGSILVVDDNPFNLLVAASITKDIGYTFIKAQSGFEAINLLKTRPKDSEPLLLILMDCQMPILDGFETAREINKMINENTVDKVPIVALTANNSDEDIKKCYTSGMVGHLSKPLFAGALLKTLSEWT